MNTYGSLFAGVGGFDMGFDRAGYDCRFQVEWDKNCQNILNRHWPDVPKWWDVSEVSGAELPPVDVLIFGSPCQDLSVAGKRAGLDGARSGLFYEAMRIIKEMRDATANTFPRVVVWENVVGALNSNGGADFGAVLDQMAEAGALVVEWAVLDAQHFGVPQRRRRIFLVACFDPRAVGDYPDPLLPVREGSPRNLAANRKARTESASTPRGGAEAHGYRMTAFGQYADDDTASAMKARDHKDATDLIVSALTANGVGTCGADDNQAQAKHLVPVLMRQRKAKPGGGQAVAQPVSVTGDIAHSLTARMDSGEDGTGRGTPIVAFDEYNSTLGDEVHHSLRAGTRQSTGVLEDTLAVRRLTPKECERLMGWPDDHTRWTADGKEQADTHRYRQCGNGVATPVAQWIAKHIAGIL